MERIKIDENHIDIEQIEKIAQEIKKGKIVIFPTETVYGIGTNALDKEACERIFNIKGREKGKPLIVLVSNEAMLEKVAKDIGEVEKKLMEAFWPGALTIILKKQNTIPDVVTAGKDEVSVRMTSGKLIHLLVEKANAPIVAPSANLAGKPTGVNPEEIIKDFEGKADYILDIGEIPSDVTSTLIRVENRKINILREGKITKEQLSQIAEVQK